MANNFFVLLLILFFISACKIKQNRMQKEKSESSINDSQRYLLPVFDSVAVEKDILFGEVQNYKDSLEQLHLDVYYPYGDIEVNRPAILWVHGGGFRLGTKEQNYIVTLANEFAKRGYVCISTNYRLRENPDEDMEATISDATEDVMRSLMWVRTNSKKIGVNNNSLIVGGGSAGGIISTNLCFKDATTEKDWNKKGIIALVNMWGSPGIERMYQTIDEKDPPTIFVHGTADTIVPFANCLWLSKELKNAGVRYEVFPIDGAGHTPVTHMDKIVENVSNFLYSIKNTNSHEN